MSKSIKGLLLRGRTASGKLVPSFQVKWFGQLAFGLSNEHDSINKEFIELSCPEIDKLQVELDKLKKCLPIKYQEGYIAGLRAYAWWKDGLQYVGSCGTTLKEAIAEALKD